MLKVSGKAISVPGHIHGFRSPVVLLPLQSDKSGLPPVRQSRINAAFLEVLPGAESPPESLLQGNSPLQAIVNLALYWTHEIQRAGGLPVLERGRILQRGRRETACWVAVPCIENTYGMVAKAFEWALSVITAGPSGAIPQHRLANLSAILENLGQLAHRASNTPRFLRAAFDLGIPCSLVAGKVFQFGQGAKARWLDSSFTDETPQIAAVLARSKVLGARVLRRAGIPVPAHFVVKDADEALRRAQELGYPVVIKPADKDGGVGVAAGLQSPEAVRSAYAAARKFSQSILVEKHVEGRDYRVVVFHGEMLRAIERTPGGIVGDGMKTVRALIDDRNAGPKTAAGPRAQLKPLELDDEARRLLAESGLTLDSVPASGTTVFLRRAANFARGGTVVEVFDQVHPDNRRLAIRAATALRLDLAGIDLLMPDIRRSWLETGAAICEVNGQPYLGTGWPLMYQDILRQLVAGNGRIPVAVLVGAPPAARLAQGIAEKLAASGLVAGWADRDGATVGGARVAQGPLGPFAGGQILMADKTVEAAILCVNDPRVLRSGLPFDRFDVLVEAGSALHDQEGRPMSDPSALTQDLLRALRPACHGKVFLSADLSAMPADEMPALVCREMQAQLPAA